MLVAVAELELEEADVLADVDALDDVLVIEDEASADDAL